MSPEGATGRERPGHGQRRGPGGPDPPSDTPSGSVGVIDFAGMPELDYALLCDFVRAERGGPAHLVGGGIDTIYAQEVPTGHNLGLLARLTFTRAECGRPHRVEIIFQDQDGKRLTEIQGVVEPEWKEGLPPGWRTGALVGLNFGVPLPDYGVYAFEILVNDSSVKSLNLRVVPREGAGG